MERTPNGKCEVTYAMALRCCSVGGTSAAVLPDETLERRGLWVYTQRDPAAVQLFRYELVYFLCKHKSELLTLSWQRGRAVHKQLAHETSR